MKKFTLATMTAAAALMSGQAAMAEVHKFDADTGAVWNYGKGNLFSTSVTDRMDMASWTLRVGDVTTRVESLGIEYDLNYDDTDYAEVQKVAREGMMAKVQRQLQRIGSCGRRFGRRNLRSTLVRMLIMPKLRWTALWRELPEKLWHR